MIYKFSLTKNAKDDFLALDEVLRNRIIKKVKFFIDSKDPLRYAKKLKNSYLGAYRFRIGDYRVIFDVDKKGNINILLILRVKHRRDVYDK